MAWPRIALATAILSCAPILADAGQDPSPAYYSIPRLNREVPAEAIFGIQGYVAMISTCPPCPKDAVCAPCLPPYVIVSTRNQPVMFPDQMTAQEVLLLTNQITGFARGGHYRFLITRASDPDAGRPGVFELVSFQRAPVANPALTRVNDPARIAQVRAVVAERLGKDFSLDHLPQAPTLERAFRYLTRESPRDVVRGALNGGPTVYGLELDLVQEQERLRVFVYSIRSDFAGQFVYTVSLLGDEWPVFLYRPPSRR